MCTFAIIHHTHISTDNERLFTCKYQLTNLFLCKLMMYPSFNPFHIHYMYHSTITTKNKIISAKRLMFWHQQMHNSTKKPTAQLVDLEKSSTRQPPTQSEKAWITCSSCRLTSWVWFIQTHKLCAIHIDSQAGRSVFLNLSDWTTMLCRSNNHP